MNTHTIARASICTALAVLLPGTAALASSSGARRASSSERSGLLATYRANDGGTTGVYAEYVSTSDSSLGVVCVRTPEAGREAFVERRSGHSWKYAASGPVGRAGNAADRRLEHAC
jgi:hypothetical protein